MPGWISSKNASIRPRDGLRPDSLCRCGGNPLPPAHRVVRALLQVTPSPNRAMQTPHLRTLIGLLLMAVHAGPSAASEAFSQAIRDAVTAQAQRQYPNADISVAIQPLDSRVELPTCTELQTEPRGSRPFGRVHVALTCHAPRPWKVFVAADVSVQVPVLVTRRAVNRGERIAASDVHLQRQDISRIRGESLQRAPVDDAYAANRNLPAGIVLTQSMLRALPAVARGDVVQLRAHIGQAAITTTAKAMENGARGEQIRVKNESSGRTVRAWVLAAGVVSTRPPSRKVGPIATQLAKSS